MQQIPFDTAVFITVQTLNSCVYNMCIHHIMVENVSYTCVQGSFGLIISIN